MSKRKNEEEQNEEDAKEMKSDNEEINSEDEKEEVKDKTIKTGVAADNVVHYAVRPEADYDVKELWKETDDIDSQPIYLHQVKEFLDFPMWEDSEGNRVTPNEVIHASKKQTASFCKRVETHTKRIDDADQDYPILVRRNEDGTLDVIDGLHRLADKELDGSLTIDAIIVPEHIMEKAIMKERILDEKTGKSIFESKGYKSSNISFIQVKK